MRAIVSMKLGIVACKTPTTSGIEQQLGTDPSTVP
jgi:hypothetical protein